MRNKKFCLIGHPVHHSFSGRYFNEKFELEGIDAEYLLVDLDDINQFEALLLSSKWSGFNVTIPYKKEIIKYLDSLSLEAEEIGAVNTIKVCYFPEGESCAENRAKNSVKDCKPQLIGYNTDVIGFESTLTPLLEPHHNRAIILGTGGASMAVAYVLRKLGIEYVKVSRTAINSGNCGDNIISYNQLTAEMVESHKLIINTTPIGMTPNTTEYPTIPYDALTTQHLLYDLVYNPERTLFLQFGEERGCKTISGLAMLYAQADAAYKIWEDKI